jgi:hypothetical protein
MPKPTPESRKPNAELNRSRSAVRSLRANAFIVKNAAADGDEGVNGDGLSYDEFLTG